MNEEDGLYANFYFAKNNMKLGEMDVLLLKKVEELTLYIIDLQKQINELKKE